VKRYVDEISEASRSRRKLAYGRELIARGLRASLLVLVASDAAVRRFYRAQRRRQLGMLAALRARLGAKRRPVAEDAVLLFTLERTCDAIASGEPKDLGVAPGSVLEVVRARVRAQLE